MRSTMRTQTVATLEARAAGRMMALGLGAPAWARRAMAVVGSRVATALLRARKVMMAGDTVLGRGFSVCSSFMAFNPKGVAPWARPRTLAVRFMAMALKAIWLRGTPGNSGRRIGVMSRARAASSPAFSAMRLRPNQTAMMARRLRLVLRPEPAY